MALRRVIAIHRRPTLHCGVPLPAACGHPGGRPQSIHRKRAGRRVDLSAAGIHAHSHDSHLFD
jgi:hypothetical protein